MKNNSKNADFGIINYWWCDDHGAILTAYALQKFISNEGYSSELLKCFWDFNDKKREGGISRKFEQKHLISSDDVYSTYDDIFSPSGKKALNDKYVGFITGSDQVFRPEYVPDSWFLSFVEGKGKIAVAASFGIDIFNCEDVKRFERISSSIRSFDYISIREESGLEICSKAFGVEASFLLDPVFLINKDEYLTIIEESKIKCTEKYIFCYIRDGSERMDKLISEMAKKYSLSVVLCHENMLIEDFLYYISNSEYVITDSYHGMCFSIIFNKNFVCVRNEKRGKTRFETIEKRLKLNPGCFFDEKEEIERIPIVDYIETNTALKQLSETGIKWLKSALRATHDRYRAR